MTFAQAIIAIQKRWIQKWGELQPSVPFSLDNDPRPEAATHAVLHITHLDSEQRTLGPSGNRKMERSGIIEVRLVGPVTGGRTPLDLLAGSVAKVFETIRIGARAGEDGVITHASDLSELRRDRESPVSWILTVTTPFEYYDRT